MKSILKWTGGKSSELPIIKEHLPEFSRYIEPFLGGGALYFDLEIPSIVNDFNVELISFYKLLKNPKDFQDFFNYIDHWSSQRIKVDAMQINKNTVFNLGQALCPQDNIYLGYLHREINSKLKSIVKFNCDTESTETMLKTAIHAALYYTWRQDYNECVHDGSPYHIAHWFILRELAYGGMFRYAKNGKFNVPYGGISYNTKDIRKKLKTLTDLTTEKFFNKTIFENMDFEDLFMVHNYFTSDDFIFLDPPYDTEFSQYNKNDDFTQNDQERLRNVLLKTSAKFLLVIKETDYILDLYKNFKIESFDKNYSVNFMNRNDRKVKHLIIKNY